jgi:hypothetical protein
MSFCVCPLLSFEPFGNLYEIQQTSHAIERNLDVIIFNPTASAILKWYVYFQIPGVDPILY